MVVQISNICCSHLTVHIYQKESHYTLSKYEKVHLATLNITPQKPTPKNTGPSYKNGRRHEIQKMTYRQISNKLSKVNYSIRIYDENEIHI